MLIYWRVSIIWNHTLLIDMYISIICQEKGGQPPVLPLGAINWNHWRLPPQKNNKTMGINPELTALWGYTTLLSVASWNIHENPGTKWRMENHRTKSWNFQQSTLDYQRVTYNWGSLIIYQISLIVIDIYIYTYYIYIHTSLSLKYWNWQCGIEPSNHW